MNRLTIIPIDGAIYVDGQMLNGFDLSFIPQDVHALQWFNDSGWIEFKQELGLPNEEITNLPSWAFDCESMWQTKHDEMSQPPQPVDPTITDYVRAMQAHFDTVAQAKDYDSALSIVSYLNSTNPQWVNEANVFIAWRDQCWLYGYQELAKFENGERSIVSIEAFISELPLIVWP